MSVDSIDKSRNLMPLAYENLGNASLNLKQPDSALAFFRNMEESLAHTDPLYNGPDILLETKIQLGLGKSYLDLGDREKGKSALRQALTMSDESGLDDAKQEASELLASMAEEDGEYLDALGYFKIFKTASDTLLNNQEIPR